MDCNFLIWSCKRETFAKILATEVYEERLGRKHDSEWFLKIKHCEELIPETRYYTNEAYNVKLFFILCRDISEENVKVQYKLITNCVIQKQGEAFFCKNNNIASLGCLIMKDYMTDIVITFPNLNITQNIPKHPTSVHVDQELISDLVSMLEKGHFSDILLKCETESLKVHKNILSARSPVFEAMFNSSMQESRNDMVVIEDMSPTTLRDIVHFIYSGKVQITSITSAMDILYAAEKYELKGLKQICLDYFKSHLSIENSIQILEIADLYDGKLKRHAMSLAKDNFEDLENTKDWIDLKLRKPVLALEVYSFKE